MALADDTGKSTKTSIKPKKGNALDIGDAGRASQAAFTPTPKYSTTLSWAQPSLISQGFGPTDEWRDSGGFNKGIDFAVPMGTPIESNVKGRVIDVSLDPNNANGWGVSVWVQDSDGFIHQYGHLSSVSVEVGDTVGFGQVLGASGNTGKGYNYSNPSAPNNSSSGPHLSYDVMAPDGNYVEPSRFIANFSPGDLNARQPTGYELGPEDVFTPGDTGGVSILDVLNNALAELAADPPTMEDPENQAMVDAKEATSVAQAFTIRQSTYWANIAQLGSLQQQMQLSASGFYQFPNGTVVALTDLSPDMRKLVDQQNADLQRQVVNQFAVDQYNLIDDARQAAFAAQINLATIKMGFEDRSLANASAQVDRQLRGMAEARARTDMLANLIITLAPKATMNGKTEFSPSDIGSIGESFAQIAGLDPNKPALKYQGTVNVNPDQMLQAVDARMGLSGVVPEIPGLGLNLADLLPEYVPTDLPTLISPDPNPILQPSGSSTTQKKKTTSSSGGGTEENRTGASYMTPGQKAQIDRLFGKPLGQQSIPDPISLGGIPLFQGGAKWWDPTTW